MPRVKQRVSIDVVDVVSRFEIPKSPTTFLWTSSPTLTKVQGKASDAGDPVSAGSARCVCVGEWALIDKLTVCTQSVFRRIGLFE
jgi:hypothetical protein